MQSQIRIQAGLRVLLAEDEPLIALDGESILKAAGVAEVVCVRTVAEGEAALAAGNFHAAFLDLKLGQESSVPLAQRLVATAVPFGFLTGYIGDAIPVEFRSTPLVSKPFTPAQLEDLLRALVGQP